MATRLEMIGRHSLKLLAARDREAANECEALARAIAEGKPIEENDIHRIIMLMKPVVDLGPLFVAYLLDRLHNETELAGAA